MDKELKEFLVNMRSELLSEIAGVKTELKQDIGELKTDVAELKVDVVGLKADVAELKADVAELKADVAELKKRTEMLEFKQDIMNKKLKELNYNQVIMDTRMDKEFSKLNDEMDTVVQVMKMNHLIPA